MRKTRFGAVVASAALASVTVLGAGTAMAQEDDDRSTDTVTWEDNYTMTATAVGECKVEFTLESGYDDNYGNWRGDYRVGEEPPITAPGPNERVGNRGETYRPVIGSNQGIADAIKDRGDKAYDFGTGTVTVDLREPRTVPYADGDPDEVYTLPGVEANETGEHVISFGVYQGPPAYDAEIYNTDGEIVVTGCPTLTLPERISSELNLPDFSELSSNLSS